MNKLAFSKYSGAGNDFILIDNRDGKFPYHKKEIIPAMAERRISIGADGLILLENSDKADIKMRYFNSDGGEAEMCANGARCLIAFAKRLGIEKEKYTIEAMERIIHARFIENEIEIELGAPDDIQLNITVEVDGTSHQIHCLNTGVPHAVIFTDDIESADVIGLGRRIRYHDKFQPKGTNVNFVEISDEDYIKVRTYERGVEDETLACGTGMIASAIVSYLIHKVKTPVWLLVRSNEILRVDFKDGEGTFESVALRGPADLIYDGVYHYNKKANIRYT